MEPLLFIAALTALHLAVIALIDVLTGTKPWLWRLGWVLVIVFLPLLGAIIYYVRAGKGPKPTRLRQPPTSAIVPAGADRQDNPPPRRAKQSGKRRLASKKRSS